MTDEEAPTVPAIPLRARQRHKPRARRLPSQSRWLARREQSFDPDAEAFFRDGDSIAPSTTESNPPGREGAPVDDEMPVVPVRRDLSRLVGVVMLMAGITCILAMVRAMERSVRTAEAAVPSFAAPASTPGPAPVEQEEPPPTEPEPVPSTEPDPASSAIEEREQARHLLEKRDLVEAVAAARRATEAAPEDAMAWLILGAAQLEAAHQADAIDSFRSCVRLAKTGPIAECRAFLR